jgi:formamidopyrimidine-DNA glycosylase
MAEVPEVEIFTRDLRAAVVGRTITLIIWRLDNDEDLRLIDTLGYARAALAPPDELASRLDLHSLGPEALDPSFDAAVLAKQLNRRRGDLKTVLLNERVLAGLGNRDADESVTYLGKKARPNIAATSSNGPASRARAAARQLPSCALAGAIPITARCARSEASLAAATCRLSAGKRFNSIAPSLLTA